MRSERAGPCLSALFVDYDNIYLALKRRDEELAKRFAKDAGFWIREIESGGLITPTSGGEPSFERRLVLNRCYGNPVPRHNRRDNSTDMSSFPFVRHHFLRAGFEVVDCPPLTAQLKNSSDIRMVMDIRDLLNHETYFDEFIILSGDADFTPVLHRLRAHARRTVIYANDYTATPYAALCDGRIREDDLMALLAEGQLPEEAAGGTPQRTDNGGIHSSAELARHGQAIIAEIADIVRSAEGPVPLETLADRAQRALGHERTIGSGWAGYGSFRSFLEENLPADIRLTNRAPYLAFVESSDRSGDPQKALAAPPPQMGASSPSRPGPEPLPSSDGPAFSELVTDEPMPVEAGAPGTGVSESEIVPEPTTEAAGIAAPTASGPTAINEVAATTEGGQSAQDAQESRPGLQPAPELAGIEGSPEGADQQVSNPLQDSIARIQAACKAPPLAPQDYLTLFAVIAAEINENGLSGAQTITNISERAQQQGLSLTRDDIRFVLDVVSEADPWFEQGASANLFAGRFRNYVVARCRSQGLELSEAEIELVDAWFAGAAGPSRSAAAPHSSVPSAPSPGAEERLDALWRSQEKVIEASARAVPAGDGGDHGPEPLEVTADAETGEGEAQEFGPLPRIVRARQGS